MFITKKHLSRRTFMRGTLGTAVALPFLDAMIPALSAAPVSPFRFGAVTFPAACIPTPGILRRRAATSRSSR